MHTKKGQPMKRSKQAQRRSLVIAFESPYACPPGTSIEAFRRWFFQQVEPPFRDGTNRLDFLRKLGEGLDDGRVNFRVDEDEGFFCVFWDEQQPLADADLDRMFAELSAQEPVIVDAAMLHAASAASLCDAGPRSPIRSIAATQSEGPTLHKASGGDGKTAAA